MKHKTDVFAVRISLVAVALAVAASALSQTIWRDVDHEPLPFGNDRELMEFMRTAEVVAERVIGIGINRSVKVTLEQDGVRSHAIFREVDVRRDVASIKGESYQLFADSYLFECAAYELAAMLEFDRVPPVVLRTIGNRRGSLQIWVEDTLDEESDTFQPPRNLEWVTQIWDMRFFDNLLYNIDRNAGNKLVTSDYRLWLIDHTRAFQFRFELLDDRMVRVPRESWERLLVLTNEVLSSALADYLTPIEIGGILKRREIIVTHIEALIAERGEDGVFY